MPPDPLRASAPDIAVKGGDKITGEGDRHHDSTAGDAGGGLCTGVSMPVENVARHKTRLAPKRAEMKDRRRQLYQLVEAHQPASVRHVFYLAVVNSVPGITKNDAGYNKVQRALVDMRMAGELPFHWIVDNTRWARRPRSYDDLEDCLAETARLYRRNLWSELDETVEVWAESDSIAGVLAEITFLWNVPLMVTRGFSSITFARNAVDAWNADGRTVVVYYIGDHDPNGLIIETKLLDYIDGWATIPVTWKRVGVTWEQVERHDLPGTPPKKTYGFPLAVEAEALPPGILRDLLNDAIAGHVDADALALHELVEAEERHLLHGLPAMLDVAPS